MRGPSTVNVGQNLTLTEYLHYNGPNDADNVEVTFSGLENISFVSANPAGSFDTKRELDHRRAGR